MPAKEMLREREFVDRLCEIRDLMDTQATASGTGD
jgi:hypothetical protein